MIKRKNIIELGFIFLLVLYFQNFITMIIAILLQSESFEFIKVNFLSISSFLLFILVLFFILYRRRMFFIFLPIIIIAFPNIINDLMPSFYIGKIGELNRSTFSLFTHIDIFLLFGIILFRKNKNTISVNSATSFYYLIIISFYYSFILIFKINTLEDLYLLSVGNYFIRYSILFILLFLMISMTNKLQKYIIYGLGLSVLLLFFESIINTQLHHLSRLTSGTLGVNVYGNIIAGITLFYIFLKSYLKINKLFKLLVIVTGIVIIILTQTKMALLVFFIVFNIVFILEFFKKVNSKFTILILFLYILLLPILYYYVSSNDMYVNVINSINSNGLEENRDTSSIFTRLLLIDTSLNMINEYPILGIGSGRWNYYKEDFGFPFHVLIDAHNDYLSFLSIFGIFIGSYFIIILLLIPSYYFLKEKRKKETFYFIWGIIPLSLVLAGFSNANTYKHQVAALIFLIFSIIHQNKKVYKNEHSNTRNKRNTKPLRRL